MNNESILITLSGSLRKESYNHKLAQQAQQAALKLGHEAININLADYPLPLFNEDIEHLEAPSALIELRALFSKATSLLIASPEYNGSFSAALKNLLDWLSRPASESAPAYQPSFGNYTVALTAASPGGLGGLRGLGQLRELMNNLGSIVIPQQLAVAEAYKAFNEQGELNQPETAERLKSLVNTLADTDRRLKQ